MRRIFGVLLITATVAAHPAELRDLHLAQSPDGTLAVFELDTASSIKYFTLSSPDRFVVDIADAHPAPTLKFDSVRNDLIKNVRTGPRPGGGMRVVLDLGAPVTPKLYRREMTQDQGYRMVFDLDQREPGAPTAGTVEAPAAASAAAPPPAATAETPVPLPPSAAAQAVTPQLPAVATVPEAASPELPDTVIPPVRDRPTDRGLKSRLSVRGFRVTGVGQHSQVGVTPKLAQQVADKEFADMSGGAPEPELSLQQLQDAADGVTRFYKNAGFIVARAFVPSQSLGGDKIVEIQVLEGRLGKVTVKGAKRYYPWVVAAPANGLIDKPLLKGPVDTALLYMRDLPGDSVTATFQPGTHTGDTDLVVVTNEAPRPFVLSAGVNDYGTELTGRYRAQLGLTWNGLLGIGDQFVGVGEYAFDPSDNLFGSVTYTIPTVVVPGLSTMFGTNHDELQISSGSFAALNIKGPTNTYYGGPNWKFLNTVDLQMQASLLLTYEQSKLSSLGDQLADEQFLVGIFKYQLNHTDRRFHGVDLLDLGVRRSIRDNSEPGDEVAALHSREFTVESLSYTRLQSLTASQRIYAKINGQYTDKALIPLEQFVIGGPDSVRAYPIADSLRDRGFYTSLEYHIDAPGFGDVISPFYARPWRELLEFETFVDYARGYSAGADLAAKTAPSDLSGAGGGFIFRIPKFYQLQIHLDVAAPLGDQKASNNADVHVYGQLGVAY